MGGRLTRVNGGDVGVTLLNRVKAEVRSKREEILVT